MSYGDNYNLFNDLHELEKMVGSLEGYLHSDSLYGTIGGGIFTGGGAPNLTIGVILLRLRRLDALRSMLDERRADALDRLIHQHAGIRDTMQQRYTDRLEREVSSRLDAIRPFFEECAEDPNNCARIYRPEAFRRTVVEECIQELNDLGITSADLNSKLSRTDKRLRGYLVESDFVWDDQLRDIYPRRNFWWLWMSPPVN